MAFSGVINAHGPSPWPTACRSPTCSLEHCLLSVAFLTWVKPNLYFALSFFSLFNYWFSSLFDFKYILWYSNQGTQDSRRKQNHWLVRKYWAPNQKVYNECSVNILHRAFYDKRLQNHYTIFKWTNPSLFFVYLRLFLHDTIQIRNAKSIDGELGTRTRGGRLEGAYKSTERYSHCFGGNKCHLKYKHQI